MRRSVHHPAGIGLIELFVGLFLALFVALAAGFIYIAGDRAFRQGREKMQMQQNVAFCVEAISRDLRRAHEVQLTGNGGLSCIDVQGTVYSTWDVGLTPEGTRLRHNTEPAAPEDCTVLEFEIVNADTSTIGLALELADAAENRVRMETRVSLRNKEAATP